MIVGPCHIRIFSAPPVPRPPPLEAAAGAAVAPAGAVVAAAAGLLVAPAAGAVVGAAAGGAAGAVVGALIAGALVDEQAAKSEARTPPVRPSVARVSTDRRVNLSGGRILST